MRSSTAWPGWSASSPMPAKRPYGNRPALEAFGLWFGTRVRVMPPNPLSVWVAELHDIYGDFSFKVSVTGKSEADVLDRLEGFLTEIAQTVHDG